MFWYEEEVQRLEQLIATKKEGPYAVFYGSSSIRLWGTLFEDFPEINGLNLGFGGSTLAACTWFFERIMKGLEVSSFVIYAGDNDLGDGRHPEEVFISFKLLIHLILQHYGPIPIGFISIKPSIQRWGLRESIRYTNKIIAEEIEGHDSYLYFIDITGEMMENGTPNPKFYQADGLHLSAAGYQVWKKVLSDYQHQLFK